MFSSPWMHCDGAQYNNYLHRGLKLSTASINVVGAFKGGFDSACILGLCTTAPSTKLSQNEEQKVFRHRTGLRGEESTVDVFQAGRPLQLLGKLGRTRQSYHASSHDGTNDNIFTCAFHKVRQNRARCTQK